MAPFIIVLTLAALILSGHIVDRIWHPAPRVSFPDSDAC